MAANPSTEQSTAAISSLSDSYSDLDSLLSSSRNLLGSLLRSQKSDTWYLETAFYIIVGTIAWLLFRRLLYGPLWWLVWLPVRLVVKSLFAVLGAVGITSTAVQSSQAAGVTTPLETPGLVHETKHPAMDRTAGDTAWEREGDSAAHKDSNPGRVINEIGNMADSRKQETNVDDISPEERARQDEMPRNPKKKMYEAGDPKDEL